MNRIHYTLKLFRELGTMTADELGHELNTNKEDATAIIGNLACEGLLVWATWDDSDSDLPSYELSDQGKAKVESLIAQDMAELFPQE